MRLIALSILLASIVQSANAVGLPEIWYPVFLPDNQSTDEKISVKKLPFATRFSHPEYIGAALSAMYIVPNNDSSSISKNINVISAHGIKITTNVAPGGWRKKVVGLKLVVDIRSYARPKYNSPSDKTVILAISEAVMRTVYSKSCVVDEMTVVGSPKQEGFKKRFLVALQKYKAEQVAASDR